MGQASLVLWDIDHTLIETGGFGGEVFGIAFEIATGLPMQRQADPTGLTEPTIFARTLEDHGINDDGRLFRSFAEAQASAYRQHAEDLRRRGRVLPGVRQLLTACQQDPRLTQSVLSGNTRQSSTAKLEAFDLTGYLDLDIGAYGDDAHDRPELVPFALARATAKLGYPYTAADVLIIGDTLADIETAHANGCRILAVATGRTDLQDLLAAGADHVLPDLANTDLACALINGEVGRRRR